MWDEQCHLVNSTNQSLFYDEPNLPKNGKLECVKLFDGFFLGNTHSSREEQFLLNNKIGLIVNCHPLELKLPASNFFHTISYNFYTKRGSIQQTLNSALIMEIMTSVDSCLNDKHEGVLVVSKKVDSRSICIATAFLMIKYGWEREEALSFIKSKKADMDFAEKYQAILINFEKSSNLTKLRSVYSGQQAKEHQILLKNTLSNSKMKNVPNFHGLSHLKTEEGYEDGRNQKGRGIKFVQQVQYIKFDQNRENVPMMKVTEEKPERKGPLKSKRTLIKLGSFQSKLRNYIKEKCNPVEIPEGQFDKRPFQLPKEEEKEFKKCFASRRRAASKTEESTDQKEDELKLKSNNFVSTCFKSSHLNAGQTSQKKETSKDATTQERELRTHSALNSKVKAYEYCHTQEANRESEMSAFSKAIAGRMFKISKSGKSSHKKIKADPYRARMPTYKSSEKKIKENLELNESLDKFRLEDALTACLYGKREGKSKKNMINLTANISIETLNVNIHKEAAPQCYEAEKKHSMKLKSRVFPAQPGVHRQCY